jgi:hypothetical protein
MSLVVECSQFFDNRSRLRGDEYFRNRRVRILGVDSDRVCAKVTGSAGYTYEVDIDLSNLPDRVIVGECTCPRFNQGDLCKHIWATLRQIQQQKVIPDEYGLVDLVLLHAHESVEDEDEDDGQRYHRWSMDQIAWLTSNRPAALPSPPNRTTATWQSLVPALARDDASERPAAGLTRQVAVARQTQAWFVVDIGVCLQRGGLLIDLYQRESQRDGDWGKIKPLRLQRGSTGPLSDPEDRRLVGLLMGNEPENPTNAYPSYYGSYSWVPELFADPGRSGHV